MDKELEKTKVIYNYIKKNNKSLAKKYKNLSYKWLQKSDTRLLRKNNRKVMKELVGGMNQNTLDRAPSINKINKRLNTLTSGEQLGDELNYKRVISDLDTPKIKDLEINIKNKTIKDLSEVLLDNSSIDDAAKFRQALIDRNTTLKENEPKSLAPFRPSPSRALKSAAAAEAEAPPAAARHAAAAAALNIPVYPDRNNYDNDRITILERMRQLGFSLPIPEDADINDQARFRGLQAIQDRDMTSLTDEEKKDLLFGNTDDTTAGKYPHFVTVFCPKILTDILKAHDSANLRAQILRIGRILNKSPTYDDYKDNLTKSYIDFNFVDE